MLCYALYPSFFLSLISRSSSAILRVSKRLLGFILSNILSREPVFALFFAVFFLAGSCLVTFLQNRRGDVTCC